jgi:hypothetical protein
MPPPSIWILLLMFTACAGTVRPAKAPTKVVEMEALRIVAKHDEQGAYTFDAYDAEDLFQRGNTLLDAGRCSEAVPLFDRVVAEFPASQFASGALYNAGLCLAHDKVHEAALRRFETLIATMPGSNDVKHAAFQVGHLALTLQKWDLARERAEGLLARGDLDLGERLEATATRAQALIGLGNLVEARTQAEQALTYYRTHPAEQFPDVYFVSAANFVLAETIRLTAEAMLFPDTNQEEQRVVLVRRAELLLEAQREYFNTIRYTNAHWAAASGQRIGEMYDKLWHDLMAAPVPAHLSPGAKEVYPQELSKLIKPLLRHAIRYWELTLMMVERTGVQTPWAERTKTDLERVRALLLEQPPGPGGLPAKAMEQSAPKAPADSSTTP